MNFISTYYEYEYTNFTYASKPFREREFNSDSKDEARMSFSGVDQFFLKLFSYDGFIRHVRKILFKIFDFFGWSTEFPPFLNQPYRLTTGIISTCNL